MNLLNCIEIQHDFENATSVSDADEVVFEINELHRSISTSSIPSDVKNSSKTNLLIAPSVSASSVLETSSFVTHSVEPGKEESFSKGITEPFKFTRAELQKRLKNLMKISSKNDDPEVDKLRVSVKDFSYIQFNFIPFCSCL